MSADKVKLEYTCTKSQVEQWLIRCKGEWANVIVSNYGVGKGGSIMCEGSFGTFNYEWRCIGPDSIEAFLLGLDFDYFMKKCLAGKHRVYDHDATMLEWKHNLLYERREWHSEHGHKKYRKHEDGDLTKEHTRELWDEIESLDHCTSTNELYHACSSELFHGFHQGEPPIHTKKDPQAEGFWDTIWPCVKVELQALVDAFNEAKFVQELEGSSVQSIAKTSDCI